MYCKPEYGFLGLSQRNLSLKVARAHAHTHTYICTHMYVCTHVCACVVVGEEEDMCGAVVAMARQFTHVPPGVVPTDLISPSYGVNVCFWHSTILFIVLADLLSIISSLPC